MCCTQYARKFGKLSNSPGTGKGQFSFQSQIRTVPKMFKVCVAQSCLTICDLMDYSQPGSSAHGFFQARILEWVVISFYRESGQSRDESMSLASPALAGRFFPHWAIRGGPKCSHYHTMCSFHMLARQCSQSIKLGFNSLCTENFQMYKLG